MNAIYEIELRNLKNAVDVHRFRIVIIYLFIASHVIFKGIYLSVYPQSLVYQEPKTNRSL